MEPDTEKSFLVAVPSNDGITIYPKMLGMAKFFYIYKIVNNRKIVFLEKRSNPYETTMQHLKTMDVYTVINDCKVILSAYIGKKGIERLKQKGMEMVFMKGDIAGALNSLLDN